MAASSGRGYHQDYIARIRYSNALPPPPNPPKLLHIPNDALEKYTSEGWHRERIAKEQPLNIEADAELGMPIDLLGIPGVFEGDEAAIFPSLNPILDEADRRLLRPLAPLGKASTSISGVSFLRRTEYMTAQAASGTSSQRSNSALLGNKSPGPRTKRRKNEDKESPLQIAKGIVKGFDLAHPSDAYTGPDDGTNIRGAEISSAEKDAWRRPQHPTKGNSVKLLDAYPVLPDWDALPPGNAEHGIPPAFIAFKFSTNPGEKSDVYDDAVDVALLRVPDNALSKEEEAKYAAASEAYAKDPEHNTRYVPMSDYVMFLPEAGEDAKAVKRKFDALEEEDDVDDYGVDAETLEPKECYHYTNVRTYETYRQAGYVDDTFQELAMALHDPEQGHDGDERSGRKAAYFYPIMQRSLIRQKGKKFDMIRGMASQADGDDAERVDRLDVKVREIDEDEKENIEQERAAFEAPEA